MPVFRNTTYEFVHICIYKVVMLLELTLTERDTYEINQPLVCGVASSREMPFQNYRIKTKKKSTSLMVTGDAGLSERTGIIITKMFSVF